MPETQRLDARIDAIAQEMRMLQQRVDDQNRIHHSMHAENRESLSGLREDMREQTEAIRAQSDAVQKIAAATEGRLNQLEVGYRRIQYHQGEIAQVATTAAKEGAATAIAENVPVLTTAGDIKRTHAKWAGLGITLGSATAYLIEKLVTHFHLLP